MSNGSRSVGPRSAAGSDRLDDYGGSRPSKTNCTTAASDAEAVVPDSWHAHWWQRKNAIVDEFVKSRSARAARPISVRDDQRLREECTIERNGGGRRAKTWSSVLNEFLDWYNGYRHAHLLFTDPEGNEVRAQMPNSHQPRYGNKYYARLKAFERQMVREYDNLHIAMLTFTGSTRNANGGWRCPADHLRDVVDSWRPDRGRGVYHALRDSLGGKEWEYALVVEKHKSGYGHVHCAVFVDGSVTESDFRPAIDAHLRQCEIAHRDAHDYHAAEESARPISIRSVDPSLDPDDLDANRGDVVGNVGSYIGEYIGAYGEPLFDRGLDELQFRAAVWATGTQVVRFSEGANDLIRSERDDRDDRETVVLPNPEFDPEKHANPDSDVLPYEIVNPGWSINAVGRVDEEGEDRYDVKQSQVQYTTIEDAQHLDPPNPQPETTPTPRTEQVTLSDST
ncbi:replication protein [Natrinema versiforme]|uniref:replication protein n=1 Tax=Natrinema versiforme TaxID=88724 RepID=UPI000A0119E6|nr:replication protein [Natrinema versiforme]